MTMVHFPDVHELMKSVTSTICTAPTEALAASTCMWPATTPLSSLMKF